MSDLISRNSVIESIKECAQAVHDNHEWDMEQGYLNAIEIIEEEPSLMVLPIKDKCCICPHCSNCDVNDDGEISSAEPTLYGYDIKRIELIARILQKENFPPERVTEVLLDMGRIVAMVYDEFTESCAESLRKVGAEWMTLSAEKKHSMPFNH